MKMPTPYLSVSSGQGRLDTALFVCLIVLIFTVPLPFGSQRNWAVALWFLVGMGMLAAKLLQVSVLDRGYSALRQPRWPLALLLGYALLMAVQAWPIGLHAEMTPADGHWPFVTRDLHQTKLWLLLTLSYGGVFALVVLLVQTRARLRVLLFAVVASGALQALLAIALVSTRFHSTFFYFDLTHLEAMGSFSGRNIFAAYMELCLSVGVGLLVASMARQRLKLGAQQGWAAGLNSFLGFLLSPKMLVRGVLVVMVIALVLTRSRMGNTAFFVSLLVGGIVVALVRTELRRIAGILVVSMLLIDMLIVGQWVGLDKVVDRISDTTVMKAEVGNGVGNDNGSVEDRTEATRQALPMVKDRPILGFGAGTFYTSFLPYQTQDLKGFWNHPHNDFMEIAVDTGLLGLGLLVALCLMAAYRAFQAMRGPFDELKFATGLACILALTCMLIHGSVDFVLQIPANAMLLCIILASVYAGEPER
jgi:O-antigen ligase